MEDQEQAKENSSTTPAQPVTNANRRIPDRSARLPYRVHYAVLVVVYFVALILALVALGSFGVKEAQVHSFQSRHSRPSQNCILYAKPLGEKYIELSTAGPCNFVLWAQVSVLIVVFVWFIYNIVLAVLGPKM